MGGSAQKTLSKTDEIPFPNEYIHALKKEFSKWAFDEVKVLDLKGKWRSEAFGKSDSNVALDLEIGTGNGFHFAHRAQAQPSRLLVGIELKYKPLIQSIRRALNDGSENARMARYNAAMLSDIFEVEELNDVFIHFPDPWPKKRQQKNRLIQTDFLKIMFQLQRPGQYLEFKTDNEHYYDHALERFCKSSYNIVGESRDLHNSKFAEKNFVTAFENIFLRKGQPIFYALLQKEG